MKIILSGGGTGGSVTPLLAIAEELKTQHKGEIDFLWLGTKKGIERKMVETQGIKFRPIFSGKFRRYFSFKNFIDPIFIVMGFFQSLWINLVFKPDIILTAGGFVAVPVVFSGWLLRIPVLVHQQDVEIGLANKLMMPFAKIITCSLQEAGSRRDGLQCVSTTKGKVYFTGNAIRKNIFNTRSREELEKKFNLERNIPTVLILGGGTGAMAVNNIVVQTISELTKFCQVIHITGGKILPPPQGRMSKKCVILNPSARRAKNPRVFSFNHGILHSLGLVQDDAKGLRHHGWDGRGGVFPATNQDEPANRYHPYPFISNVEDIFEVSDLVISRCGMAFLSELAVLGKPAILIPIPDSHQEANAKYFFDRNAARVLNQKTLTAKSLVDNIKKLLQDKETMKNYSDNMKKIMPMDGAKKIAEIVLRQLNKN
ncbi:MAG: UDP-N-acetylglucosamine--N-acetylmuramyl-(pentapeptide) pyrophosphoryl-undecaprenol N-acetylglucosamine transferase [bacterium]